MNKPKLQTVPHFTLNFDDGNDPIQVHYYNGTIELTNSFQTIYIPSEHFDELARNVKKFRKEAEEKLLQ